MNRARIEELAGAIAIANSSLNASVQRALTTLARECYEDAAKVAGRSLGPASAAAAIREKP